MFSRLSQATTHRLLTATSPSFITHSLARPAAFSLKMSIDESRKIKTAACLVIGDELLSGKTFDTNSAYMAKWCFKLGMDLERIEVVQDKENDIMEAVSRLSNRYDFIITSGGIGPTHDDITYPSIAKAFGLPLKLHEEAFEKMKKLTKPTLKEPNFDWNVDSTSLRARLRMVELPIDESRDLSEQFLFPHDDMWVPVVVVNQNVHILPGVPSLFQKLLDGLTPFVSPRVVSKEHHRILISTPLNESFIAEYLTQLAAKAEPHGVKIGSYPRWNKKRNTVTLTGRDKEYMESLVAEAEEGVQGQRVSREDELD
ncbi:MoaB/Mog domain-containing protein [Trichoderma sp. SZMC 28013]